MKIIKTVRTAQKTGERLSSIPNDEISSVRDHKTVITVDSEITFQKMLGFGGAFTEAAAVTLSKISGELRQEVLRMYFDPEDGLGYNLGRVHIHSCDFALGNYSYVEENDKELKTFNIEHDRALIIPLIRDAMKQSGRELTLLASPWSPPAWMKSNRDMNHGGKLLDEYKDSWALYYTKFINAYQNEGIPIWGITVQNEPDAVQTWDSCIYSAEEERDFIKNHLGPGLHKAGMDQVRLLIWDHNRDIIVERARTVLDDSEAAKYVWGTGFHWYVSEEFENIGQVHELFPDKHLLFTEGCQEGGCKIGEWFTGERYGRNMIGDFNNWCEGYLDWNLVLDETGGPNHVNNLCDAAVIVDTVNKKLIFNSSYYYIGQFSKYVQPGASRIFTDSRIDFIHSAAFINEDGTLILIVMNEGDIDRDVSIECNGDYLNVQIMSHSIITYVLEP
ncbi:MULTISPECIES: glycoside hydrolase family 30 beta sandwich domain-containing protein [unclassified Oceanispirochaeta]|uniref:glycoside hydrolase family 30 protein n=1 Tax=unclassified Oceanispirochaeta TaxID=2635722 RepID=UPI000E093C51|nr:MULTISPECIES: glycoside hydrolase family 30 protein [unclassified Oceanispirochaeta]MBF9017424.1 glycoside hydrolase family 30 protein [Oceanispirochaeta sp. M2]NPD73996.1 glycoside hydrolase family 30 protein [Oceanispirochaeta sp. M1]RDG30170.1 glucosylceramidase [Oceanispirochaeta sp. M1]